MNDLLTWRALGVFACAVLVDFAWCFYIRRTVSGKAAAAATWGLMILLFGVFNTISWLENRWMLIPMYLGAWIGTYAVVKWDHRNDQKKSVPEPKVESPTSV